MKYKVGDKVRIKSLDWYNAYKNSEGAIIFRDWSIFDKSMSEFCDKVVTIDTCNQKCNYYDIVEDGKVHYWTDNMFECLVIEDPHEKMVSLNTVCEQLKNTIDDDVLVKCGSVIKCMDVEEFILYFRKAMNNDTEN